MNIALGWDHRGRRFRDRVQRVLAEAGDTFVDLGATSDESSDYPDFAFSVAEAVARGAADRGILICGSGIGMCIAANKVQGIRAALVQDEETARLSRAHNDSNVLCLSENLAEGPEFEKVIRTWLQTAFAAGRHARRVNKITDYEKRKSRKASS